MTERVDVAILGAGFAGIGMGIRLRRDGRHSFVILERADEVGGTWRDNVYPGVASDVPAHLYSFSFRQKPDWSRRFAPGGEIVDYLREAVHEEGLTPHLRLGSEVLEVRWRDGDRRWTVRTVRGEWDAASVVLAAGRLAEPVIPAVTGLEGFAGEVFHSARWPARLQLAGKRVGVVGTGSSAARIVPAVAAEASSVTVFQRTPAWVMPRDDRAFEEAEKQRFANAAVLNEHREELFRIAERGFAARSMEETALAELRATATAHREAQVADPALRALLTPDYEIGCKRIVISDDYFPALAREHVELVPSAVTGIEDGRVVAADGSAHDLDVLVFATGFNSTRPPYAGFVTGRGGRSLADHWSDGMAAYASTVVHGFPGLFVLGGPNATLGHNSAVHVIESQIGYVLGALAHPGSWDVTAAAEREYIDFVDERGRATVWTAGGCSSWYLDADSGRLALVWPGTAEQFRERNGVFDPGVFERV